MINNVTIMGRLTAAPELKVTESGTSVLRFCVAVERAYVPKGQERQTDFINVVAWRQTAEFVDRNFNKGQMIAVEGSIQTRKYQDGQGNTRTAFEVVANNVSFCGDKKTAPAAPEPEPEDPLDVEYDDPYLNL
ncbi:MAG TPA: single-stranded DNA-binding protein [Candidatus Onthovicinus excrementipullorum]|nr:single-stranded DNA-binding protein [Candidatus Onthovicinus excrementipullorum]